MNRLLRVTNGKVPKILPYSLTRKVFIPTCVFTEKESEHIPLHPRGVWDASGDLKPRQAWRRHKHGAAVGHRWIRCRVEGGDWAGGGPGLLTRLTRCSLRQQV